MNNYIYFLKLVRPEAFGQMTDGEEAIVAEHFTYFKRLLADGRLELAGPCLDGFVGIAIIAAEDREAASAIMESDPAVKHGLMTADLHPFRISLANK